MYAKRAYGVPAEIGREVTVDGRPGIIAKEIRQYIGVLFDDDDNLDNIMPCHPTHKVVYGEMGTVRQWPKRKRRGKANYQEYLDIADCFDSFLHFLKWKQGQRKRATNYPYGTSIHDVLSSQ
jgi:hypothetical protein